MSNEQLYWENRGTTQVGVKSENKDLCDGNGVMWLEQSVLRCPSCGKLVRDYTANIGGYRYCPGCGVSLKHKGE